MERALDPVGDRQSRKPLPPGIRPPDAVVVQGERDHRRDALLDEADASGSTSTSHIRREAGKRVRLKQAEIVARERLEQPVADEG